MHVAQFIRKGHRTNTTALSLLAADSGTQAATLAAPVGEVRASHDAKVPPVYDLAEDGHETYHGLVLPTEEEKATLRRVAGKMPASCYYLCAVEFAERASYYGCNQVYKNFIRAPLPAGGNGAGAVPKGNTQLTAGALGRGSVVATAMTEAFKFLAYALPVFFGWLADTKYGRFRMICQGVAICGIAHIIMIISSIPSVLQSGNAIGPFALSLYMLSIGAGKLLCFLFMPLLSHSMLTPGDNSPVQTQYFAHRHGPEPPQGRPRHHRHQRREGHCRPRGLHQ